MYIDMKAALTCALKTVFRKKLENCARLLCFRPKPDAPTIADKSRKSPRIENVGAANATWMLPRVFAR